MGHPSMPALYPSEAPPHSPASGAQALAGTRGVHHHQHVCLLLGLSSMCACCWAWAAAGVSKQTPPLQCIHHHCAITSTVQPLAQYNHQRSATTSTSTVPPPAKSTHQHGAATNTEHPPTQCYHQHRAPTNTVLPPAQSTHQRSALPTHSCGHRRWRTRSTSMCLCTWSGHPRTSSALQPRPKSSSSKPSVPASQPRPRLGARAPGQRQMGRQALLRRWRVCRQAVQGGRMRGMRLT